MYLQSEVWLFQIKYKPEKIQLLTGVDAKHISIVIHFENLFINGH